MVVSVKTKDETYTTFLKFKSLGENQFDTKIKATQTD